MRKKYNTEEERKEAQKIADAKWYAKNKAKAQAAAKLRQSTPEAKAKLKAKRDTPEAKAIRKAYDKERLQSQKDGLFRVYMLTSGYVGQTADIYNRMNVHRNNSKRDTSNYIVLHECDTREDAKRLEAIWHSLDFKGYNNGK